MAQAKPELFDFEFTGHFGQCEKAECDILRTLYPFSERVPFSDNFAYKFLLDIVSFFGNLMIMIAYSGTQRTETHSLVGSSPSYIQEASFLNRRSSLNSFGAGYSHTFTTFQ